MDIIEYKATFTYSLSHSLLLVWFDNFTLSNIWEIIRIKYIKTIEKTYKNKIPVSSPKSDYDIAIYSKNRWILLKNGIGSTTSSSTHLKIKNLEISNLSFHPILSTYSFKFDFHVLLTLIQMSDYAIILEKKNLSLTHTQVLCKNLRIKIYENVLSYRGDSIDHFTIIANDLMNLYSSEYYDIKNLYSSFNIKLAVPPAACHLSIAYKTWYNAKRQNQREWPCISHLPPTSSNYKNLLEFPKNSNIFYYHPTLYVALAERNDISSELYIPKLYKSDHYKNKKSILYNYINDSLPVKKENPPEFDDLPPYNESQVIHDYAKLGRLLIGKKSKINEGIVDPYANDKIYVESFPTYLAKCLETHRQMTFKRQKYVSTRIIYD